MKRNLTLLSAVGLLAIGVRLPAAGQTSNVQTVRAWTRTYVIGMPGGTLLDPTGTIADAQRLAAAQALNEQSSSLVQAAAAGLSNALDRLTAATDRTNDFTGRLYISADLDADPGYANTEAYRVHESVDPDGLIHYFTHFSRELAVPPKTVWAFETAPGSVDWSPGVINTNNATTNVAGYACYDIAVRRPAASGNVVLVCNKFLKFGAGGKPLDIPDAGLQIISGGATNEPFTGSVAITNSAAGPTNIFTETYLSGFLFKVETNTVESL